VQQAERDLYPRVLQSLIQGRLHKNAHGAVWIES
jgi:hypothetical protein